MLNNKSVEQKHTFKSFYSEYSILFVLIILMVITSFVSDVFLNAQNLINIIRQTSVMGILAIGVTFVLIGGYIDLSVGSTISLVSVITCTCLTKLGILPAVLIGLLVGGGIGFLNGVIIKVTKARNGESLMLTLGTLTLVEGSALLFTGGYNISFPLSNPFSFLGQGFIGFIPVPVIIFIILAVVTEIILCKTRLGRSISLLGANQDAAELAGIKINKLKVTIYIISGVCAAIAAIISCARTLGTSPISGKGMEFDAIMAVILGGTSMNGGSGNIRKTVLGVLVIGVLSNALNIVGINGNSQFIVKGAVIILAVYLDTLKNKSNGK